MLEIIIRNCREFLVKQQQHYLLAQVQKQLKISFEKHMYKNYKPFISAFNLLPHQSFEVTLSVHLFNSYFPEVDTSKIVREATNLFLNENKSFFTLVTHSRSTSLKTGLFIDLLVKVTVSKDNFDLFHEKNHIYIEQTILEQQAQLEEHHYLNQKPVDKKKKLL